MTKEELILRYLDRLIEAHYELLKLYEHELMDEDYPYHMSFDDLLAEVMHWRETILDKVKG